MANGRNKLFTDEFLMYRVELKAKTKYLITPFSNMFLMYRVELKESY